MTPSQLETLRRLLARGCFLPAARELAETMLAIHDDSRLALNGMGPVDVGVIASPHPWRFVPLATFATLDEAQAAHSAIYFAIHERRTPKP